MGMNQGHSEPSDRSGGRGYHGRATAGEGNDDVDDKGNKQVDLVIDTRHEGKGDDLGYQSECRAGSREHCLYVIDGSVTTDC